MVSFINKIFSLSATNSSFEERYGIMGLTVVKIPTVSGIL